MAGNVTVEIDENNDLLVSASVFAGIINKSRRQVTNYKKDGIPIVKRGSRSLYPVRKAFEWLIKRGVIKVKLEEGDAEDVELLPPNIRKDLADAKLKEFNLKILEGKYILKEEEEKAAANLAISLRDRLMSLPDRIVPGLEADEKIKHAIRVELKREFTNFIADFNEGIEKIFE